MNNKITSFKHLEPLEDCKNLQRLVLINNMVAELPDYRLNMIRMVPSLRILDFKKVTEKEREQAKKLEKEE